MQRRLASSKIIDEPRGDPIRKLVFASVLALAGLASAVPAQAMPFPRRRGVACAYADGGRLRHRLSSRTEYGGRWPNGGAYYHPYAYGHDLYAYGRRRWRARLRLSEPEAPAFLQAGASRYRARPRL
jgi:hypothetical protein